MLRIGIVTHMLDGTKRADYVEVPVNTKLSGALNQARSQGFVFSFGKLSINDVVVPKKNMSSVLDGRMTRNCKVFFREYRGNSAQGNEVIDIESLLPTK